MFKSKYRKVLEEIDKEIEEYKRLYRQYDESRLLLESSGEVYKLLSSGMHICQHKLDALYALRNNIQNI